MEPRRGSLLLRPERDVWELKSGCPAVENATPILQRGTVRPGARMAGLLLNFRALDLCCHPQT